jgi:ABC-type Fe3+-hydroxamate transport system substrate-binding protein
LAAWGVEPVACTRFCERPDLPHVGGTKNPDVAAIVALRPDVVVLDRQENRREDADALVAAGLRVAVLDVRSVDGLPAELDALAGAVGAEPGPSAPSPAAVDAPPPEPLSARAFVPIWRRPWRTIGPGTYGSSVLAAIGIENVFSEADGDPADYPQVSLDAVAERRPDVVLVPSEPYAFRDDHLDPLAAIAPVVRVDGQDLFWWGTRTPGALDRLRSAVPAPR